MGLLSAGIFQGLGAGVSAFGGQMMRGVEKEQDEAMLQQRVRVLAEIQRENAKLNRQDALDFETDPNNLTRRTAAARTTTLAAADTAREVETASLADPKLNEARRAKAADDAKAAKKVANDQTIEDAANPELLAAKGKIALADPEVAARIAASRASAASSGAHAGLLAVQTAGARLAVEDQKRLGKLYDDANAALTDPNLTDDERGKKVTSLMTQATLIKSKNAPAAGKNPELDTVKVEETMDDGSGKVVKTTRTEVRRPGAGGGGAENYEAPTEATIRKMAANLDNPQTVAEFKKRFGADAFAQVSAPKSGKPRHLRLPDAVVPILSEWQQHCPKTPEGLVFPRRFHDGTWGMVRDASDMLDRKSVV